jgi:hypothetical protein
LAPPQAGESFFLSLQMKTSMSDDLSYYKTIGREAASEGNGAVRTHPRTSAPAH